MDEVILFKFKNALEAELASVRLCRHKLGEIIDYFSQDKLIPLEEGGKVIADGMQFMHDHGNLSDDMIVVKNKLQACKTHGDFVKVFEEEKELVLWVNQL